MPLLSTLLLGFGPGFLLQDRSLQSESPNGSAASLVSAELAFAKHAESEDTRAAFLAVLDDEGVLFRPGPVNGKAWLAPRKPDASKLTWYPSRVEVSRSGDLGYSTGPYQWRAQADSKEVAHGHFVSVWGRQDGAWKLLLDAGVSHAAPPVEIPLFKPGPASGDASPIRTGPTSGDELSGLERAFAQLARKKGLAAAYGRFAATDLRFYRDKTIPLTNAQDAVHALASGTGTAIWTNHKSRVSKSGDLGYTYGLAEQPDGHKKTVFLHLWKRAQVGGWKLVLDLETPLPPEKPHP